MPVGKSAIAVALQVCLGSNAKSTGRGTSIVKYIREGTAAHQFALITVTLHNRGSDAYLPEIYGKKIIVQRKITKEGSGGYVLMDENSNVCSISIGRIITTSSNILYDKITR